MEDQYSVFSKRILEVSIYYFLGTRICWSTFDWIQRSNFIVTATLDSDIVDSGTYEELVLLSCFVDFDHYLYRISTKSSGVTEVMAAIINNTTAANTTRIWESAWPPGLQFFFGVVGNLIALIVLCSSSKRHKWKPFYRLVGALALTDMCGVLFIYPTVMIRYASDFTFEFSKPLCNYSSFIHTYVLFASALIVCAMSFDRFLAIIFPYHYNTETKVRRVNIILISIWIFTLMISSLHLGLGDSKLYYPGSWCFLNFVGATTGERVNLFIYSILGLLILLLTICLNVSVIISVCVNLKQNKLSTSSQRRGRKKNNMFIILFLLVIVAVFITCWLPLMVRI